MIHKGQKYEVVKTFTVTYTDDNGNTHPYTFVTGERYISPEDNTLLVPVMDSEDDENVKVAITPEVADLNFKAEQVNHPYHYNCNNPKIYVEIDGSIREVTIECIDVIRNMPTWKGNVIKYAWRAGLKEEIGKSIIDKEIEDLEKAKAYIDDRINQLKLKQQYNE